MKKYLRVELLSKIVIYIFNYQFYWSFKEPSFGFIDFAILLISDPHYFLYFGFLRLKLRCWFDNFLLSSYSIQCYKFPFKNCLSYIPQMLCFHFQFKIVSDFLYDFFFKHVLFRSLWFNFQTLQGYSRYLSIMDF